MQKHEALLRFAEFDLRSAKSIASSDDCVIAGILYHVQQCVEKSLKAFLLHKEVHCPRSHDLTELLRECIKLDTEFKKFCDIVIELNPYSTKTRYPDDSFPPLFKTSMDKGIEFATQVFEFTQFKTKTFLSTQTKLSDTTIEY